MLVTIFSRVAGVARRTYKAHYILVVSLWD
jgi:hypothetical protein